MRVKAGNSQSEDVRTLEFPAGFTLAESDGHVTVSTGGSQPISLPTIALIGSSITVQNGSVTGFDSVAVKAQWDALGYWNWANIILGQRFLWTANKGVGTQNSTQILARFGTDIINLSPRPGFCVLETLIHDVADFVTPDVPTAIANVTSMINQCLAVGIRPVLCTITPTSYTSTTAQKQAYAALNHWAKVTAPTLFKGLIVCDWSSALTDPTSGGPSHTYFLNESGNYVHPNNRGAMLMGKMLAGALSQYVPPLDVLASDAADSYNLIANAYGIGGGASTLPTGCTVVHTDGSAFPGTGRVGTVTRSDNIAATWAEVSVQGDTLGVQMYWQNLNAGTDWVAGTDSIYGYVEFETDDDWSNIKYFYATCEFFNGLGDSKGISARSADGILPETPRRGVFFIPPSLIPVGATRLQLKVYMFTQSGACSGTFRVSRPTLKKVGT